MKNINNNEALKKARQDWGLQMPEHWLKITKYHCEDGKIVITEVKVFDRKDNFIKLADINKLAEVINKYPIKFE